jgi:4-amino-4-deoxy-L-arabinose transferase-like glycosyltransferase
LTKGPVGVVIPVLSGTIFLWRQGALRGAWRRFRVVPGLLVTAAIAAPWFIAITVREPGFFDFYFIGEHFRRFFDKSYSHDQPIYYYVPIIIGGLLPWTLVTPLMAWRRLTPNPARRFCYIASATILILFSLSSAKLVPYILPALPPIAIVIADGLASLTERGAMASRRLAAAGPLLAIGGMAAIGVAIYAADFRAPYPILVRPALEAGGAILIIGGAACTVIFRMRRIALGIGVLTMTAAALLVAISYGRLQAEPYRSYANLAREIERQAPDARLVCYPRYVQSLPFYTRRRVILVGGKTELAFGSEHDADAGEYFFIRRADLLRLWNDPRPTVLVIDRFALDALKPLLGSYTTIASDPKKVAIMRAAVSPPDSHPMSGDR